VTSVPESEPRLVLFGSFDATLHPRVAVLAEGLAAHGWRVHVLNAPLGASTADKVASAGSVRAAARLGARQLAAWGRLIANRFGTGHPDAVLVGYLGHADVHLARVLFPRSVIALDHLVGIADTLGDRGLGGAGMRGAAERVDRAALRSADVVVVDTALQAQSLPTPARFRTVVAPVGAQEAWERAARAADRDRQPGEPLRVVFFGLYTPLQGAVTIGEAIALLRDAPVRFTMIGDGQQRAAAQRAAADSLRVRWLDWVDGEDLPTLVASHDVCLGIFDTGPKAARVVPTKVYQGLAAGCAVVSADTEAMRDLADAVLTVPPGDAKALAATLDELATDPAALAVAQARSEAAAARITSESVTEGLNSALREGLAERRRRNQPPLTLNAWFRWDVIAREIELVDIHDVLEIGPGEGALACRLAVGHRYTGVELSERTRQVTAARLAAQGTPGRLLSSLDDLAPDERFDLVCAFEVIEHIDDDARALAAWVRHLRPGGLLLLSTPADPERFGAHDVLAGHFRRYEPETLAQLARDNGLRDIRVFHTGYPMGYPLERARHLLASRRLAAHGVDFATGVDAQQVAAHTERSSSLLQPPGWSAKATRVASAPGRWAQRLSPDRGTGLVLSARARL
jgi:SAM-dependent methyltransferase